TTSGPGYSAGAADTRNCEFYFVRNNHGSTWSVEFENWLDPNGADYDFFVFEVGGDDAIQVAPRLLDGSIGQYVSIGGWTSTGYAVTSGDNSGQQVYGLAIRRSQLRLANGNPVTASMALRGIVIESSTIDGAACFAVNPMPSAGQDGDGSATVSGPRRTYEPVTIDFQGPWASETDDIPNPFLDYRLNLEFIGPSGQEYKVPGFFAGDGDGGHAGRVWRVRFTPDEAGYWRGLASFRSGSEVAVNLSASAGNSSHFDGRLVTFTALPKDQNARGIWKHGRLQYVGKHYAKFTEGPYFLKSGTNSPENMLGYHGLEEVSDSGGIGLIHEYQSHRQDWQAGDPNFRSNVYDADAKGLIGMLNYLSSQGVNSVFTMLMNLGGDGQDTHPFISPRNDHFDKLHYDLGRMEQWTIVFEHAASVGIAMHLGLNETESQNERWLDFGNLNEERKLFYREMVARFSHLPAIRWNLCEETDDFSVAKLRDFADYIHEQGPYGHTVTFHNHTEDFAHYNQVYGEDRFEATSQQYTPDLAGGQVEDMRANSAAAGKPWIVQLDENNPWFDGLADHNQDDLRQRVLYDVYFSGGHIEWYLGWHLLPLGGDLTVEDLRTRADMWNYMRYAREFMEAHLPFWDMQPMDGLLTGESNFLGGGEVFALPGEIYAVYLPDASPSGSLNLSGASGTMRQRWFNPRNGQFAGNASTITAGSSHSLGSPPTSPGKDWVVLIDRSSTLTSNTNSVSTANGGPIQFQLSAGAVNAGRTYLLLGTTSGTTPGVPLLSGATMPLNFDRYARFSVNNANSAMFINTSGTLGAQGNAIARIQFPPATFSGLVGTTMHHAYVLLTPQVNYASEAVPLLLLP
ncbi:MAG: hypothetical protein ACI841_002111, partial [Planctomycetota bacterium]